MSAASKKKITLAATGAVVAALTTTSAAMAGGFAVREQSAEYQGMSFAGNAAGGGGLSAMFWNAAAVAQFDGIRSESHYAFIIPSSEMTALAGTTGLLNPGLSTTTEIGREALVGASYLSYQLTNRLTFGFSFNAPFGLTTKPDPRSWAGQTHATTSDIKTYNGQAVLAYKFSSSFMIGAGLMVEHIEARLKSASGIGVGAANGVVRGDDTGFGFTLGAIWNPSSSTSLGLGFRSAIQHTLEGTTFLSGLPIAGVGGSIKAGTTLPEVVTFSLRQAVSPSLMLLGTVEWTNWSRLDKLDVICTSGASAICPAIGTLAQHLPLNWHDGWFFSLGLEQKYNDKLTLRTGVAYEISPIQNPDERTPRVPDSDRIWASVGATYKWSEMTSFDLAYSHIFIEDSTLARGPVVGNPTTLNAAVSSSVDIVSASMKIRFGAKEDYEPLK